MAGQEQHIAVAVISGIFPVTRAGMIVGVVNAAVVALCVNAVVVLVLCVP